MKKLNLAIYKMGCTDVTNLGCRNVRNWVQIFNKFDLEIFKMGCR